MDTSRNRPQGMSNPSVYQIKVRGHIASDWSARLEGMQITESQATDGATTTTLVGSLADQAALSGILNTLYELHLPVISVTRLDDSD